MIDFKRLKQRAVIAILMAITLPGLSSPGHAAQDELLGEWIGESICQVKGSPCHDEKAIYRISKAKEVGKVIIDAGKIVDGKPVSMGVLEFKYDKETGILLCEYERGVWRLTVKGNRMEGTLTLPDKTIYRRVSLKKS